MGLTNIRDRYGNVVGAFARAFFGYVPIRNFLEQLVSTNREPIDYRSPVQMASYPLTTWVGGQEGNRTEDFTLPTTSHDIIERIVSDIFPDGWGGTKGIRKAIVYGHEYLSNPGTLGFVRGTIPFTDTRTAGRGTYLEMEYRAGSELMRSRARINLSKTLAHLSAARLHLYHRQEQFRERPELEELMKRIENEQLPRLKEGMRANINYWL